MVTVPSLPQLRIGVPLRFFAGQRGLNQRLERWCGGHGWRQWLEATSGFQAHAAQVSEKIRVYGGRVTARNLEPRGAKFTVVLPLNA